MSDWSSGPIDALLRVGGRYIRSSRIESIETEDASSTGSKEVTVTMFSGKTHQFRMSKADVDRFAKHVMGDFK